MVGTSIVVGCPVGYHFHRSFPILQFSVLASSSAGNATLVASSTTRLLIDAGLSRKETFERLIASGVSPETLSGILITHEHSDHVSGLSAIAKKLNIPVYVSRLTAPAIPWGEFTPTLELFQALKKLWRLYLQRVP